LGNPLIGESAISGEDILRDMWLVEMGCSKWTNLAILLGMVFLYRLIFLGILKMIKKFKPIIGENMLALRTVQTDSLGKSLQEAKRIAAS